MNPYEKLANAIILRAVEDYRAALERLSSFPDDREVLVIESEVKQFFRSKWFSVLTTLDPEMLIRKLNEEVR